MHSLVVARDGAGSYQCSDSRLLHFSHFSRGVFVLLPARFQAGVHSYGFRHLIYGSAFDYTPPNVAIQSQAGEDWTTCDTHERWYYFTL